MTNRQTTPPSDKAEDPWKPLLPERLVAAVRRAGFTPASLAREMDRVADAKRPPENRQTLHALMRGKELTRCRASRRRLLARVLKVPERWLAGETVTTGYPGQLAMHPIAISSPMATLAGLRLHAQLLRACARDLEEYLPIPSGEDQVPVNDEVLQQFSWCLGQILSARRWRMALLQPTHRLSFEEVVGELIAAKPPTEGGTEEEEAVLGLVEGLKFTLWPWVKGKRALNYGRLRQLASATTFPAAALSAFGPPPKIIRRKDGQTFAPNDPRTPYAVLGWTREPSTDESTTQRGNQP